MKATTIGIWMWSEIFTHDFENGDKVAIILLDTQGIFDSETTVKECTTIFGLTTTLSSVQLFNVKEQIQEDDLQHLDMFTAYASYILNQTNERAFQTLNFVVRDWPYPQDTRDKYGWEGQMVIDRIMADDAKRSPQMRELRDRIRSSFQDVSAFLLPHPGMRVARGNAFTGDLKQIDPEFILYVKELVQDTCAPENLLIKKINGQKVRARDLVLYFKDYLDIFNTMPPPDTLFEVDFIANIAWFSLLLIRYQVRLTPH